MIGSGQGAAPKQRLVLVVDDDVTSRLLASAALEDAGFVVVEARDGVEALERFAEERPDLVLLDVEMPRLDGVETCKRIRTEDPDVPILMLTGLADLACIRNAFAAGATDFAVKPVSWLIMTQRCHFALKAAGSVAELRGAQEQTRAAHRLARLGTWQLDVESRRLTGSQEFFRLLGYPVGTREIELDDMLNRLPQSERERVNAGAEQYLPLGKSYSSDVKVVLPNGQYRVTRLFADPIIDENGEPIWISGICQDVTEQVEAEAKIRFLSQYDSITGLAGHTLLDDMLETAVRRGLEAETLGAVLAITFSGVRRIQESFGQKAGDAALQQMSSRVLGWARENGSALFSAESQLSMVVARLGSVELALILPEIDDPQRAGTLARQLLDEVSEPLVVDELEVVPAPAVGIAVWPHDGRESDSILRNAGMAMEHASRQVERRYRFFTSDMNETALRRIDLERELRQAIDQGELRLYYQPKVDVATGRITGAEALLRWQHPETGLRFPLDFIPLAEETGLILPVGEWAVREACRQQRRWRDRGLPFLAVAANLSPAQLVSDSIVEVVAEALRETDGDPGRFELEITETALLHDAEISQRRLEDLKSLGVRISLDDFGTGYSSLSHLKSFPVDTVKIDRSFIDGLGTDASDTAVTEAVVSLARALGLHVVAEGAETVIQWQHLRRLGCDEVQGFLFSRAVDADAFEGLLRDTPWLSEEPDEGDSFTD
jgi:PAS domain S-box-containing protein